MFCPVSWAHYLGKLPALNVCIVNMSCKIKTKIKNRINIIPVHISVYLLDMYMLCYMACQRFDRWDIEARTTFVNVCHYIGSSCCLRCRHVQLGCHNLHTSAFVIAFPVVHLHVHNSCTCVRSLMCLVNNCKCERGLVTPLFITHGDMLRQHMCGGLG